ncbi:MAG: YebC/PmpR family DNA-binding transcriptional regulator [Acidobacteriota bacterium]
MAGHSKWANIKRRKAAVDAKRGKIFTRLLREVMIAARMGGGDPDGNPRLRSAIADARGNNVPNDNIDRAIKKGVGELGGAAVEEVVYEGYGPGGVAMLVEVATDNRNRTVGEVRHAFTKYGGNLGENGSVAYLFDRRGYFVVEAEEMAEDAFLEMALELEVDDVTTGDEAFEIFTIPERYNEIKASLAEREVPVAVGQLAWIPQTTVGLDDGKTTSAMRLIEALEDLDDVQNVWANLEVDETAVA